MKGTQFIVACPFSHQRFHLGRNCQARPRTVLRPAGPRFTVYERRIHLSRKNRMQNDHVEASRTPRQCFALDFGWGVRI